ncbi:conserved hypothetical protein [Perkinsus marinus ATCC 50983]|uniref:Amidohydrolase-related domain-containing protein n=1 Tax=Perkinsus marinus (strain ATCC 50983 / TXsc) TaxID=423536 RepID=C5LMN8_PERM5|nr:conserved hypothetical protein [Perkinsus marinus ATCC 50983]EER01929.1 conserved hypothetical protein [Perkinsus marinus ATCC 50983]|eukprot:XP_002769211.1 conserved hypothetical protein [Perkinsus marinus ATCC 50983]
MSSEVSTKSSSSPVTCIRAGWVVQVDEDNSVIPDGCVVWDNESRRILNVCPFSELPADFEVTEHLPKHALMPGLINCHTHSPMTPLRGYSDDQNLQDWLQKYVWPAEGKFVCPEFVKLGSQLGVYEMLLSGSTAFVDMYMFPRSVAEVANAAHIRDMVTPLNIAHTCYTVRRASQLEVFMSLLRTAKNYCQHQVPKDKLSRISTIAESAGTRVHVHLHESQAEVDDYLKQHGESAIDALDEAGLLNDHLIAAHCVHMTDDEIARFAEAGANAVHCPRSNAKLASGIAKVQRMLDAGVNVCLGTDGPCCNNSMDMLQEMQYASLLGKVAGPGVSPKNVNCYTAVRMATINGAKAVGRETDLGSLEAGKLVDMIAIDLGRLENQPVYDPVSSIVYTNQRSVTDVWIGAERVVRNREVQTMCKPSAEKLAEYQQQIADFKAEREAAESTTQA